jgi:hypothetical protein
VASLYVKLPIEPTSGGGPSSNVNVVSSVLPNGAATAARQDSTNAKLDIQTGQLNLIDVELQAANASLDSIDAKLTAPLSVVVNSGTTKNYYSEVLAVASGLYANILTHTVTVNSRLKLASSSGSNIAEYEVVLNGLVLDKQRTNFGAPLNCCFSFQNGVALVSGDFVIVRAKHERSTLSDFNAKIIIEEQ